MALMKDLNYFPLCVESNIYSMAKMEFDDRSTRVLVATLDCKIFCINYNKLKSHTKEVEFTYIPSGAKISSIGALKRGPNDFVIGITHFLAPSSQKNVLRSSSGFSGRESGDFGKPATYYLNIYASGSLTKNFDLDYVAQGCQTLRLRYVPYHLYQTEVITFGEHKTIKKRPFWLLSGGDNAIHAFCEDKPYQSFNEIPIDDCFPELNKSPGLALWIDALNFENQDGSYARAIALALEDGSVRLYHGVLSNSTGKYQLVKESSFDDYTTIIPCLRLFKVSSVKRSTLRTRLKERGLLYERHDNTSDQIDLLVVSSTNPSLIFKDVTRNAFSKQVKLPESQRLDCVVTSAVGDIDFDGLNEIILGTHGQELLIYKYDLDKERYFLASATELNNPIFAMCILDLTGDALNDLVILLASGILILQADVNDVMEVCRRRIETLYSLCEDQDACDTND